MNINNLIEMANDIGNYFKSEPDHEEAVLGIATHMQRFWEDRMIKQIVAYLDEGGEDLSPTVKEAISKLKASMVETD
ncbi:MAG: formate dehydrogenase subunit delta [Gammaproteobacteria bacterium]|nr:formate dehydrogenase subunit delta [Gammaproteobacteria bacterium]